MQFLTSLVLAAFVAYAGSWYLGFIEGNFALLLFMATVVTGIYWLAERFVFLPRRQQAAAQLEAQAAARRAELSKMGIEKVDTDIQDARDKLLMQPWWLDWTAGLFPVIVVVFILRSFLFEPFKIPSGSMIPTLQIGDLILVNKFTYGLRLPVVNTKLTAAQAAAMPPDTRAALDQLAARVKALVVAGTPPERIAIAFRDLADDTEALLEALEGLPRPVLVAYNFVHDKDRLLAALSKVSKRVATLRTDAQFAAWARGEYEIGILHPASAGHGLNLQAGGNIIVWYDMTWSLEQYQQANARLHRQGQTKPVIIHRLIANGTMDGDVLDALDNKADKQEALMRAVKARIEKYRTQ